MNRVEDGLTLRSLFTRFWFISKPSLTVERLAEGLRALASDGPMRERARTIGESIRSRDALRAAVSWLEGVIAGRDGSMTRTG